MASFLSTVIYYKQEFGTDNRDRAGRDACGFRLPSGALSVLGCSDATSGHGSVPALGPRGGDPH